MITNSGRTLERTQRTCVNIVAVFQRAGMCTKPNRRVPSRSAEAVIEKRALKAKGFGVHFVTWVHADINQQSQRQAGTEHTGPPVTHQGERHPGDRHQSDGHAGINYRL